MSPSAQVLVAAFVGTDHHPFDRLVSTVDEWLQSTHQAAAGVIQYGSSSAPCRADGRALIPRDDVLRLMRRADIVVCHGGPATIADARSTGHRPIVMPRNPERGEHVDDHQMLFAARLAHAGLVSVARDADDLLAAMEWAAGVGGTGSRGPEPSAEALVGGDDTSASVDRIGRLVDELLAESAGQRRFGSVLASRLRRRPAA